MLSVVHLRPGRPGDDLVALGRAGLDVLARRPGFVRGSLGRSTDDTDRWVLVTEWDNVGDYRRALGHAEVKMTATPLFYLADGEPSGFEQLVQAVPGATSTAASDVADQAR